MARPTRILVFRFSAMGDVAMAAAVLRDFALQFPEVELQIVSRATFQAFFEYVPGSSFIPIDTKGKHKGILGLFRLFRTLRLEQQPDAVADLHDNLRSRILSTLFRLCGIPIKRIRKDREKKKALTRKKHKIRGPLLPTIHRYAQTLQAYGFDFHLRAHLTPQPNSLSDLDYLFQNSQMPYIGISPFAQHATKVYPLNRMEALVEYLSGKGYNVLLFGGGKKEADLCQQWQERFPNTFNCIGSYSLAEELKIISRLTLMLSMDSAGMHMASLMQIPCISIWGSTHPDAGFMGYGQKIEDAVQIDLACRPCSVYGNIPCYRKDHACMHGIELQMIIDKIENKLQEYA